ncbi:hypothetical protein QWJ34_26335 [Saccharibacillus sp. CPCC 101409]|uniref:hypothetical protein n=1 Tax=Saccharibacillus sp. CPCC 101409 TaxID=3058041 RepID=UPI00267231B4|nr:hypothetical protein [Saccharibacillus sp. CPCC 101409]MDO3413298.1 hypothetical protein [Saccharibacillus sp. CPCC 101409]
MRIYKKNAERIELHLFAPQEHDFPIELLTVVAHYHYTGRSLGLGHAVNFGAPQWNGAAAILFAFCG